MCAAPKGNQFWKLRSKHGRDKIFENPEILWEAACEYFEYIENNPIEIEENKGTKHVNKVKLKRPFTWSGLNLFLDIDSLKHYKSNEKYKDFFPIIRKIDQVIYTQKFEGATIGIFKENIISYDLGLRKDEKGKDDGSKTIVLNFGGAIDMDEYKDDSKE